jgi:cardiolipin synthase A/B
MSAITKNKKVNSYTSRNKVKLLPGGKPYFDCLLRMIENAKESIHLQVYIFDDDETGRQVATALKEAAKRKVDVYLLVDGYESGSMAKSFINDLRKSDIYFRLFNPLFKSRYFYFGRRLHQKIVVIDAEYALVGGINIANRYNDMPGKIAWLDFALYIEGEAARDLCILCWKGWNNYSAGMGLTPCEQKEIIPGIEHWQACNVSMRRNDWVRRKNEISATYIEMLRNAKEQVVILCSYFLPGRVIRRQLNFAAERGVRIKVITAGSSDIMAAKYAEKYMYDWLLKNNIEIYEYLPTVLHGKIAVCDGQWMTIGSYNINNISAYASIELNINVRNADFAKQVENVLQQIIDRDCVRITKENHAQAKNIFNRFARWSSYEFIRLTVYLFTFYFKHRR